MNDEQEFPDVRCFSVEELASQWRVGKTLIYDEIRAGRLPVIQFGRGDRNKFRVNAKDAAEWVAEHRHHLVPT